MNKYRFAFVSNSMEVAKTVLAFADTRRMDLTIRLATMEEAVPVARELLRQGMEIILGGGATGRLLRSALDEPVVTIARSHLDILYALRKAKALVPGRAVGLTSFAEPLEGLNLLRELLDLEVREVVFSSTDKLIEGIRELAATDVGCIVGSGICRDLAQSMGIEGLVVTPGAQVITRCLSEAMAIAQARRRERSRAEHLRVVLESIREGVAGIDAEGRVSVLNRAAADMLDLDPVRSLGEPLPEGELATGLGQALSGGRAEVDQVRRLGQKTAVVSILPVLVGQGVEGAVATIQPAGRFQNISRRVARDAARGFTARYRMEDFLGSSQAIVSLRAKAARYAHSDASVLIQGETGTGKEVLAQAMHRLSQADSRPFVAVNCSALPDSLLESELFGYEEGAFTGARRGGKQGLFELAHGGTIFLDEIADISPGMQVKLLRVLEEKEVLRLGGDRVIPVRVRVLSSSYKNLALEARLGRFRADLYYRLSVLRLHIPPLRERLEDIPELARSLAARYGVAPERLRGKALEALAEYDWPGNIRELDALMRRFSVLSGDPGQDQALLLELLEEMTHFDGQEDLGQPGPSPETALDQGQASSGPHTLPLHQALEAFERDYIRNTLRSQRFNRKNTAQALGISVNTLWRRLKA